MNRRTQRKATAQWEANTRRWAIETARYLALSVYRGDPLPARPYALGVVLGPQETAWVECPARLNVGFTPLTVGETPARSHHSPWLVTSERIIGRLADNCLYGYRWDSVVGCRLNLAEASSWLCLERDGEPLLTWSGPGVAPMALAAVYRLYGARGLLEHHGLTSLRTAEYYLS